MSRGVCAAQGRRERASQELLAQLCGTNSPLVFLPALAGGQQVTGAALRRGPAAAWLPDTRAHPRSGSSSSLAASSGSSVLAFPLPAAPEGREELLEESWIPALAGGEILLGKERKPRPGCSWVLLLSALRWKEPGSDVGQHWSCRLSRGVCSELRLGPASPTCGG